MQEPFVDFLKSDLQARAMLIKAAFDLFTVMQRRGIQVSQPLLGASDVAAMQLFRIDCLP